MFDFFSFLLEMFSVIQGIFGSFLCGGTGAG